MGKQIKITEDQLKRLIVAKEGYATNLDKSFDDHLNEMNDEEAYDDAITSSDDSQEGDLNEFFSDPSIQVAKRIAPMVIEALKEEMETQRIEPIENMDEDTKRRVIENITNYIGYEMLEAFGLGEEGGEEEETKDMPGFEGTTDALNNLSIRKDTNEVNESIVKIKNNFNRFL